MKPVAKKAESAKETSEFGRTPVVEESGKVDSFFSCIICYFCLSDVLVKPIDVCTYPYYIFLPQKIMTQLLKILRTLKSMKKKISDLTILGGLQHCSCLCSLF